MSRTTDPKIRAFILDNLEGHEADITQLVVSTFGVTRQTASNYMSRLIMDRLVVGKGQTNARTYKLRQLDQVSRTVKVAPELAEDVIWREVMLPRLTRTVPENVLDICSYGFNEIFNNVLDHSESGECHYYMNRDAVKVRFGIGDKGVGIFEKIRKAFDLSDRRHALLELSKGKLTTDESKHTGEGIFFSSRMMDRFSIMSNDLYYSKSRGADGWLIDVEERPDEKGTLVTMNVAVDAEHTVKDVLDEFSTGEDYGFAKTVVPLTLAKYEGEKLISRSQAKRLMARVEKFRQVYLDFEGIDTIGPAFADEIFRVFAKQHLEIQLIPVNANEEVLQMVRRALSASEAEEK